MTYRIKPITKKTQDVLEEGTLIDLSYVEVRYMLCFNPNIVKKDDTDYGWTFEVEGRPHKVWSRKNSFLKKKWFVNGTDQFFELVFGTHYIPGNRVLDKTLLAP